MGALNTKFEHYGDFSHSQAVDILNDFKQKDFDFFLGNEGLQELLETTNDNLIEDITTSFDPRKTGFVTALEFICGVLTASKGSIQEKVGSIFDALDLRQKKSISYDELVILLEISLSGAVVLRGYEASKVVPPTETLEILAAKAFTDTGMNFKDQNNLISKSQFCSWVETFLPSASRMSVVKIIDNLKQLLNDDNDVEVPTE